MSDPVITTVITSSPVVLTIKKRRKDGFNRFYAKTQIEIKKGDLVTINKDGLLEKFKAFDPVSKIVGVALSSPNKDGFIEVSTETGIRW
jgi:hypothetical protein